MLAGLGFLVGEGDPGGGINVISVAGFGKASACSLPTMCFIHSNLVCVPLLCSERHVFDWHLDGATKHAPVASVARVSVIHSACHSMCSSSYYPSQEPENIWQG